MQSSPKTGLLPVGHWLCEERFGPRCFEQDSEYGCPIRNLGRQDFGVDLSTDLQGLPSYCLQVSGCADFRFFCAGTDRWISIGFFAQNEC